jgi:5-methylcytosine-specific restriction endonuclease McrA
MSQVQPQAHEPVDATPRLASAARRRAFRLEHDDGNCPMCGLHLLCLPVHIDHILPVELGGEDTEANWQLLCIDCHKIKTRDDIKRIAKARRQRAKHNGTMPASPFKLKGRGFSKRPTPIEQG